MVGGRWVERFHIQCSKHVTCVNLILRSKYALLGQLDVTWLDSAHARENVRIDAR